MFRSLFKNFPAASHAASIAISLSLVLLVGMQVCFHDRRPKIFLLGDSAIGNYRLDPGQRLQDFMERRDTGVRVENWAEPGATPLDFFLQYSRGSLVAGSPRSVVIALAPDKFLESTCAHRLDEDGVNLRWIPWDRTGVEFFRRLSPRERSVALVQQVSVPFYAVADVGRSLWIRYVQWPWERSHMRTASIERQRMIEKKSLEWGRAQDTEKIVDDRAFDDLPKARDAEFLVHSLREKGIETKVIILPFGNPNLIRKTCSKRVLASHDTLIARMRDWLEDLGVTYVDFNTAEERGHFPDSDWDDLDHLKAPSAFAYMSDRICKSLVTSVSRPFQRPMSYVQSGFPSENSGSRN